MPQSGLQLADIFQQVANTLVENQQTLNKADSVNQDHGDNMVQTFQTIANSLNQKQGKPDSEALAFAARKLSQTSKSGSGQLYAQGLAQAATQFKGQELNPQSAMQLLQTLIGGGQSPQVAAPTNVGGDILGSVLGELAGAAGANQSQPATQGGGEDLLGSLLGGLAGAQSAQTQQPQSSQSSGSDALGALLGGLTGGNTTGSGSANNGLDMGDLLNAGMAFMQARQSGSSNMQAAVQAFMAASGMGGSSHRNQSTQLVVSSFLNALGAGK